MTTDPFTINLLMLPLSLVAFLALMMPGQGVLADDRPTPSIVTIEGMHCPSCAKAVSRKLQQVTHVAIARIDARSGLATVTPARDRDVSAKGLWEAVEAAGYRPTRLEGPSGVYTTKPTR